MFKPCLFIIGLTMAMASGCGKGEEQAKKAESKAQPKTKSKKEPAPASKPPPPAKAAKTPKIKSVAEIKKTPEQEEEDRFLESLRPQHEGKPSTLKIELEKLRAKGEPVTLKELDAWYKAVPPEKNAALAFQQITNSLPKNATDLWLAMDKEKRRQKGPMPILAPALRSKVQAYLVAHQAYINQLFTIAQRYPVNQPARFPIDCTRGWSTLLPQLAEIRKANKVLMWRSQFFATQKRPPAAQGQNPLAVSDQQQAVSSILVLLRMCHLLDAEPYLISFLVQIAATHGKDPLETLINMRALNDPQLVTLQQAYASFNWPHQLANALIGEQCAILGGEAVFRKGTQEQMESIDPDEYIERPIRLILRYRPETMRDVEMTTYIGLMSQYIQGIRKGYPDLTTLDDDQGEFLPSWNRYVALAMTRRHVMKYPYTPMLMPAITRLPTRVHQAVLNQQFATTALAIERFRLANQWRIPRNLAELVPTFLTSQPFDPYNGKPLRYIPGPNGAYELRSIKADKPENKPAGYYSFKVDPSNRLK
jgi:hypothetical protein